MIVRIPDGGVLCARCRLAATPWLRLRGLLGRELAADEGLLIRPTNSIHMFFMGYAIDAVFLDKELRVLRVAHALAPWRTAARRGSRSVLELPAGTCERVGVREGDVLTIESAEDDQ